jgi:hypothetical protein
MHFPSIVSFLLALGVLSTPLFSSTSDAYTLTSSQNGALIRWNYGQKYFLAGNPISRGSFSPNYFFSAVTQGLQQWKWATQGSLDFDYWQGTDPNKYPAKLAQDGQSAIFLSSNSTAQTDSNVIGFTQVWYNTENGDLIEADIVLNDRDYDLTTTATDTSSNGSGGYGIKPKVFLNNVITHELGHAIGLSHSSSVNASMLYVEYKEQSKVGCDDWSAARHLYPSNSGVLGKLTGTVVSPIGVPVAGATVSAISKDRGSILATAHTEQNGQFFFGALEVGTVALVVQPFQGSSSSIPARLAVRASDTICTGTRFPSFFSTESDGNTLAAYSIEPSQVTQAGTLRIQCQSVPMSSPIGSGSVQASDFFVDSLPSGSSRVYEFQANGPFRITTTSHILLSSITPSIQVTDASGRVISTQQTSPTYQGSSNFKILDTQITGTATGLILVRVTSSSIGWGQLPSPTITPGTDPYFVLSFSSQTSGRAPASRILPDNARCAPAGEFPAYQSPDGDPVKNFIGSNREMMGFCASIAAIQSSGNNKNLPPPSAGALVGWFLPFLIAAGFTFFHRFSRKRLQ